MCCLVLAMKHVTCRSLPTSTSAFYRLEHLHICIWPPPTSVTSLLNQFEWSPLSVRQRNSRLVAFYKAVSNLSPVPVGQPRPSSHQTRSHNPLTFTPLTPRTDYKYSFLPHTIVDWNSQPFSLRAKPPLLRIKIIILIVTTFPVPAVMSVVLFPSLTGFSHRRKLALYRYIFPSLTGFSHRRKLALYRYIFRYIFIYRYIFPSRRKIAILGRLFPSKYHYPFLYVYFDPKHSKGKSSA